MATARAKQRHRILNPPSAAAGVEVTIPVTAAEFFVRAVDAAGVPVAFTLAHRESPARVVHYTAGESWSEERLCLTEEIVYLVVSAAGGKVEVDLWEA